MQPRRSEATTPRRSRARQRGAAMVEAVVAIPFFIILFAAIVFMGSLYASKLRAMREARSTAWNLAVPGCDGDGAGTSIENHRHVDWGNAKNAPVTSVSGEPFGDATGESHTDVKASAILGGYTTTVHAEAVVPCNEKTRDASLTEAVSYLWNAASASVSQAKKSAARKHKADGRNQ